MHTQGTHCYKCGGGGGEGGVCVWGGGQGG